jgi:hypothetical protein
MADPVSLDVATPITTLHLVDRFMRTRPRVTALCEIARPIALRRGSETLPAQIFADARDVLADVERIVGHQRGARRSLQLTAPCDWATLLTRLELALVALAAFRQRYSGYDTDLGYIVWHDEIWRDFTLHRAEYLKPGNHLHES